MKKTAPRKSRLPEWFRQEIPDAQTLARFRSLKKQGVNTVCLEARCPNWSRCFRARTLAFMILGSCCTRSCSFCAVEKSREKSLSLDKQEPYRILKIIKELRLNFVIITSVTRDDLDDYGSGQFARTISLIRDYKPDIKIEILIPDFLGGALSLIVQTHPDVLAHNLETVPRLYPTIRRGVSYQRGLQVLAQTKNLAPDLITKSSLLLGMGETQVEVIRVMDDLIKVGCDILVLGQYLAPTPRHHPVREFVSVEQFQRYKDRAFRLGFRAVLASPLARTSYRAQEVFDSIEENA
jgi:lipoic acid synthetase